MNRYSQQQFEDALVAVGIQPGDSVFSHSNLGNFGMPEGEASKENAFQTILRAFQSVLGPDGTLIVPTFTYSFSQGKAFDAKNTPSDCGMFTEMVRCHPDAIRSRDPHVSVAAIGKDADFFTRDFPGNSYIENSFFDRFYKADGKICNLNFDAASTFIHYVERCMNVPYRFDKTFSGIEIIDGKETPAEASIYVRYLTDGSAAYFEAFDQFAREKGYYVTKELGRGFIGCITAKQTYDLIQDTLPKHPNFLTESFKTGTDLLIPSDQD